MSGRPVNTDRANALRLGLRTYEGAPHSKCGTTTRYVSGGGCVHCARLIATEQREALKYIKANAIETEEAKVRNQDGVYLDTVDDDAVEAHQKAIDELM